MNFKEWSSLETIQTKLAPSPTSIHKYALPLVDHIKYFGGKPLNEEDALELANLMELAFNRGIEIGIHKNNKELEKCLTQNENQESY